VGGGSFVAMLSIVAAAMILFSVDDYRADGDLSGFRARAAPNGDLFHGRVRRS